MPDSIQKIINGIFAGALAAFIFHQTALLVLKMAKILPDAQPWNWAAYPHPLLPAILMVSLWGGFWGAIIALAWNDIPGDSLFMRGAVAGLLGPGVIGTWIVVPWINGQPFLAGGDVMQIATSAVLFTSYGVGVGIFLLLLEKRRTQRPERRRVLI